MHNFNLKRPFFSFSFSPSIRLPATLFADKIRNGLGICRTFCFMHRSCFMFIRPRNLSINNLNRPQTKSSLRRVFNYSSWHFLIQVTRKRRRRRRRRRKKNSDFGTCSWVFWICKIFSTWTSFYRAVAIGAKESVALSLVLPWEKITFRVSPKRMRNLSISYLSCLSSVQVA